MDWIQIDVYCPQEGIEPVSAILNVAGAREQEIIGDIKGMKAHLEKTKKYWDYVDDDVFLQSADENACIRVHVAKDRGGLQKKDAIYDAIERLQKMQTSELGFDPCEVYVDEQTVYEQDWANNWRQFYHSMEIGDRLIVTPEWEDVEAGDDRVVLRLEPGLVFGTGEHQTTQLCLEDIVERVRPEDRVLDLGCGSGILSIAALLLGAESAVAVDVDPNAKGVAETNAQKNDIAADRYDVYIGDVLTDAPLQQTIGRQGPYPLVLSNIVADVIVALAPQVGKYLTEDGVWICSGIITERLDDVKTVLDENGFTSEDFRQKDDWWSLVARKR